MYCYLIIFLLGCMSSLIFGDERMVTKYVKTTLMDLLTHMLTGIDTNTGPRPDKFNKGQ